jgi:DNA (cytosine-5)-methyltransferase 1
MKYIDLFAGAGGLSEGFIRAGFDAMAHIEMNPDAVNTLKTRLAYWHLKKNNKLDTYYSYLREESNRNDLYAQIPDDVLSTVLSFTMSKENLKTVFKIIDGYLQTRGDQHINMIVGGPPCQGYSLAGRARQLRLEEAAYKKNGVTIVDHRKYLYLLYCEFLKHYKPDMFVFENVPGLFTADNGEHWEDIQTMLQNAGYNIEHRELNAKDFGVPQSRKRIIVIGWKKGLNCEYPDFTPNEADWTIADILGDLPAIQAGEEKNKYRTKKFSEYVGKYLRTEKDILTWHIARPHCERDRKIYRKVIKKWVDKNKHNRLRYQDLPEELRTHNNIVCFQDRFKVVAPDTPYCHTMLAHISKDGHYFIHPDIDQARSLTVREAARIQSFPDNYYFEGSRTSVFTQIGNAVPPLMAEKIAKALKKQLQKNNKNGGQP